MVTRLLLALTLLTAACQTKTPSRTEQGSEFDAKQFDLDAFTGRVHGFLRSRKETKKQNSYDALFVNTEHCTACMRGTFAEISPYLKQTDRRTFIYANDSSLLELVPENKRLQFVWLPVSAYREAGIFHNKIYLYQVNDKNIRVVNLGLHQIDSLNNLGD
jgi:hypothetical protein